MLAVAAGALLAATGAGAATDPDFGTATTVSLSSTSIAVGGSVTLTASVTGVGTISSLLAPTGTVQFSRISGDGTTTPIGVATLFAVSATESRASLTTSSIPSGTYSVVAFYTSDDPFSFFGSDSTGSPQTLAVGAVTFHNTHTVLTATPAPAVVGDTVLLTATVTRDDGSGIPTGIVRFSDTTGGGDTWIADAPLVGGVATYPDSSLSAGTHQLLASYVGQFFDTSSGGSFALDVNKPKQVEVQTTTTLTASPATIRSDKPVTLTAHVVQFGTPTPPPGGGVVTFVGNGVMVGTAAVDANGDAVLVKGGWAGGDYTLLATYVGNIYDGVAYQTSAGGGSLKVTDALETKTAYDGPLSAQRGDSVPLSATLTAKATGAPLGSKLVTLSLGSLTCSATTDAAGHATCSVVADLPAASYPVSATFDGDDVYVQSSGATLFTVTLRPTSLAYDGDTTAASGHAATLSATLASNAAPLSGKTVTLALNGNPSETCSGATDASGHVSCAVTVSEPSGTYPIAASYAGDATYAASSASAQMRVTAEIPTRLTYSGDPAAAWGAAATIAFTLTQNDGTPVTGKTVSLTIDGHTATATTDGSGRASLPITAPATPGPYTVSGSFAGDADYLAAPGSGTLAVQRHATTLTYAATSPTTVGQPAALSATLRDANGSLLGSEPVTLSLAGGGSCAATTTPAGVATCTVTANAPAGARTLAAGFAGDSLYLASSDGGSLTVVRIATTVSYAGDTEARSGATATLAAILKDASGQPISGKALTLSFSPSGSCTTGPTDANGYASCPLVVGGATGPHTVTASFAADDAYAGSSGDGSLTITTIPTTLVYDGATQVVTGNEAALGGTLTDVFGHALSGQTVSFTLSSGETCSASTDVGGHAACSVPVAEDAGDYTVSASFAESLPYLASGDREAFAVLRAPTSLASADATVVTGRSVTLTAALRDQFGLPLAGEVTLTVAGQTCTQPTTAGAISCPLTIDRPAGDYEVDVSYAGDARNLPASATATLTVQKAGTIVTLATVKPARQGGPATLQATLTRADTNAPVPGRQLTLGLGAQSCTTPATGADGTASCTIPDVTVPLGPQPAAAGFGGDGYYLDSSAGSSTVVYALGPGGGVFVVGDRTASGSVYFWGSRWWKVNLLSGSDPAQFKGYALNAPSLVCGAGWSTNPGNSSPPPGAPLPAYMGVIVTSSNGKKAPNVNGDVAGLVIVRTDAGYAGNPGHDGTGTVVAGPFCP